MLHTVHNHVVMSLFTAACTVVVVLATRGLSSTFRPGFLPQCLLSLSMVKGLAHFSMPAHTRISMSDVFLGAMRTCTDCFVIFVILYLYHIAV